MSLSFPYRYDGSRRSPTFGPFSHHLWDPFDGVTFSSSPSLASLMSFQRQKETSSFAFVSTRVDWKETPEAHVFMADLPGVKKEEIKLRVEEGRVLHISGERSRLHKEKTDTWHRVERSFGRFKRRLWIPENGKMDQVKAAMEDGVLTVTVPKEEAKEVEVKSIEITD